jgi:hypothetical protein
VSASAVIPKWTIVRNRNFFKLNDSDASLTIEALISQTQREASRTQATRWSG